MLNTEKIEYPAKDQQYEIADKIRRIQFTGRMIGKASTRRPGGVRWTEITIYVTVAGRYVIQREGVSLIYHRNESACQGGEVVRNEQILDDAIPCPVCRPPSLDELDEIRESRKASGDGVDPARYRREVTMSSADIAEEPGKIIPILTYHGRLTAIATEAIKTAMENDPRIQGVFDQVEVIA